MFAQAILEINANRSSLTRSSCLTWFVDGCKGFQFFLFDSLLPFRSPLFELSLLLFFFRWGWVYCSPMVFKRLDIIKNPPTAVWTLDLLFLGLLFVSILLVLWSLLFRRHCVTAKF